MPRRSKKHVQKDYERTPDNKNGSCAHGGNELDEVKGIDIKKKRKNATSEYVPRNPSVARNLFDMTPNSGIGLSLSSQENSVFSFQDKTSSQSSLSSLSSTELETENVTDGKEELQETNTHYLVSTKTDSNVVSNFSRANEFSASPRPEDAPVTSPRPEDAPVTSPRVTNSTDSMLVVQREVISKVGIKRKQIKSKEELIISSDLYSNESSNEGNYPKRVKLVAGNEEIENEISSLQSNNLDDNDSTKSPDICSTSSSSQKIGRIDNFFINISGLALLLLLFLPCHILNILRFGLTRKKKF